MVYIASFTIKIGGVTLPTLFDVLIEDPENGNALGRVGTLEMPSLVEEDLQYGAAELLASLTFVQAADEPAGK